MIGCYFKIVTRNVKHKESLCYNCGMSYQKEIFFNGKRLVFEIDSDADESVCGEIFVEREYRVVEDLIAGAALPVIDVGAHKGMFSVYVRTLNPSVRVFAYEPEEKNFAALKKHLKMNHVEGVVCKNLAVVGGGDGDGGLRRRLYLSEDSHNHSLIGDGDFKNVDTVTVSTILSKVGKCALVKMDCEGAEFEILRSISKENFLLVQAFYVEYHECTEGMNGAELRKILEKNGYKVVMRVSPYDKRMGFIFAKK